MQEVFEKIIRKLGYRVTNYKNTIGVMPGAEDMVEAYENAIKIVSDAAAEYNNGWIPCSERLPDDGDARFYMCIVENHEEDLPMFYQYEEGYGFGFWRDYYDGDTLGFVDSEFQTNEELGYEKVVVWMPLPAPYKPKED